MAKYAFIVAGVIASSIPGHGIVVLGNIEPPKVLRIGQFYEDLEVFSINRKYVDFKQKDQFVRVMVGYGFPDIIPEIETKSFEDGSRITRVTDSYRTENLSPTNLAKILMQAGVSLYTDENDEPIGYQFHYIEDGSIYDIIGLKQWDIVTKVNDLPMKDSFNAIKSLKYLQDENEWNLTLLRDFVEIHLIVRVN